GAIFNMLDSRGALDGACVLDAFCGTGALGLEALSRGAKSCDFIDVSRKSLALARTNAESLGVYAGASYSCGDAKGVLLKRKGCESVQDSPEAYDKGTKKYAHCTDMYNLVFLDPPYHKSFVTEIIRVLMDASLLYYGAWVVCETEAGFDGDLFGSFRIDKEKAYGQTKITLLQFLERT
ncbi:MAG: RsmD family RNA methyltransferase, partial [Alphaproteobacteria bacterium]